VAGSACKARQGKAAHTGRQEEKSDWGLAPTREMKPVYSSLWPSAFGSGSGQRQRVAQVAGIYLSAAGL
jgi:hypothetical protein